MKGNMIATYSRETCYTLISEAPDLSGRCSVSAEDQSSSYAAKGNQKHYLYLINKYLKSMPPISTFPVSELNK